MLERIEHFARLSVARACGFAGLAVCMFMLSLLGDIAAALRFGGLLSLVICAVLLLKGINARRRPYKHTEVWIILPKDQRPRAEIAQQLIGNVLREVYFRFAEQAALVAAGLLFLSLALSVAPGAW